MSSSSAVSSSASSTSTSHSISTPFTPVPPPSSSSSVVSNPPSSSIPPSSSSPSQSSTVLTSASTTESLTTITGTSEGKTFTTIVHRTSTISPGSTGIDSLPVSTKQTSSHTGAIVGGVIGGLALITVVVAAALWYRRRSRYRNEFDGNFDPARVTSTRPVSAGPEMIAQTTGGTLPRMNIDDDEDDGMGGRLPHIGGIVTPFSYAPSASAYGSSARSFSPPIPSSSPPPMSQHSQDGYTPTMSSAGGYYTAVPQQAQAVGGYYPPAPSSTSSGNQQYTPRSAKEREALGAQRSNFGVANPSHENELPSRPMSGPYDDQQYRSYLQEGPQNSRRSPQETQFNDQYSPASSQYASSSGAGRRTSSGVLVHQDGGRVENENPIRHGGEEIPPTYDSLPAGERK
ncbi:hypothetical protein C8J57DRAFT_1268167 [Mycena rebaudengoi]|nr:hypothetical protein C8J57DRAFT_1268167 [Mycena rebaudengoi]